MLISTASMNIHQFKYVLALAEFRHFERAAEKCFVTQSTLSTMIAKLEQELGVVIFDRKKKPLEVSAEGEVVINHLKVVLKELDALDESVQSIKGEIRGDLSIAVIPTIAPFLLPRFLPDFAASFPLLNIEVREHTTAEIIRQLSSRELDIGIVSIPIEAANLRSEVLYDEPFLYYDAQHERKKVIKPKEIDVSQLCLLEEGHCMRTQVLNLCDADETLSRGLNFNYRAGSLDGLMRFVRAQKASTLVPLLATLEFDSQDQEHLVGFATPKPFRSVGLIVHQHFAKERVLQELKTQILSSVEPLLDSLLQRGLQLDPINKKAFTH